MYMRGRDGTEGRQDSRVVREYKKSTDGKDGYNVPLQSSNTRHNGEMCCCSEEDSNELAQNAF